MTTTTTAIGGENELLQQQFLTSPAEEGFGNAIRESSWGNNWLEATAEDRQTVSTLTILSFWDRFMLRTKY